MLLVRVLEMAGRCDVTQAVISLMIQPDSPRCLAVPSPHCLQSASFKANRVIVRPGLHNLASLTDLRLKSTSTALAFVPGTQQHGAAAPSPAALLPPGLRKARVEGCLLTSLPPAIVALRQLEDLVLSDNHLRNADLEVECVSFLAGCWKCWFGCVLPSGLGCCPASAHAADGAQWSLPCPGCCRPSAS